MNRHLVFNRIFASLFDLLIIIGFGFILLMPAFACLLNVLMNETRMNIIVMFIASFLSGTLVLIMCVFYLIVFPGIYGGQTLGKKIFNIRIRKINGCNADFRTLFLRNMFHLLVIFLTGGFSLIIDLITLCLTKDHLTFYDIIASTCIIDAF